ncbi:MAG: hypothetical protein HUJ60_01135, partial [Bacilli bacterium]|nr:hypothetical protein [Bacilli bacterium]
MKELLDCLQNLLPSPLSSRKGAFVVEESLGAGLLFAAEFKKEPQNMALVTPNLYAAERLYEFLLNFFPEEQVIFFPADELLRAEALASSHELLAQRLYAMGQALDQGKKKILVTHPAGLMRFLPRVDVFEKGV